MDKTERFCIECGKSFIPKTSSQIACSPQCSNKRNIKKTRQYYWDNREQILSSKKTKPKRFKCPMCGRWHNTPRHYNGHSRQYCMVCYDMINRYDIPDEIALSHHLHPVSLGDN